MSFITLRTMRTFSIIVIGLCAFEGVLARAFKDSMLPKSAQVKSMPSEEDKGSKDLAEWSILTYIQADNSLASFASYNINDMKKGMLSSAGVNLLVQWDQPGNNKTWRYKINPGSQVEAGSLNSEMGYNPENEIVAAMQWVKTNYPAKHYALILWNHGSGIEDIKSIAAHILGMSDMPKMLHSWLEIPGATTVSASSKQRGILYDDSQGTLLTNQMLASAVARIKTMLGKNIDILGMDACLMAMLEVAYQIKDCADYFVGSQQTEPGEGWPYSLFLKPLTTNPAATTPLILAQNMVLAYKAFYAPKQADQDFTLSAINLSVIQAVKQNLDQIMTSIAACQAIDASMTKAMVIAARKASTQLYMPEYIDLISFYAALLTRIQKTGRSVPKSDKVLVQVAQQNARVKVSPAYQNALDALKSKLGDGFQILLTAIVKNAAGPQLSGARGLSIYYPRTGTIHPSYPPTLFAQDSNWINFIQTYR